MVKQSAAYRPIAHGHSFLYNTVDVVGCCCCCWPLAADDVVYTCVYTCFLFLIYSFLFLFLSFLFFSFCATAPVCRDQCTARRISAARLHQVVGQRERGRNKFFHATSSTSLPPSARQSRASPADGEVSDGAAVIARLSYYQQSVVSAVCAVPCDVFSRVNSSATLPRSTDKRNEFLFGGNETMN